MEAKYYSAAERRKLFVTEYYRALKSIAPNMPGHYSLGQRSYAVKVAGQKVDDALR